MKASDLIGRLRALVREHGDRDVFLDVGETVGIEDVDLESTGNDIIIWPAKPAPVFSVGERVDVVDGPFVRLKAKVVAIEDPFIHASVDVYGRSVEMPFVAPQLRKSAA